MKVDVRKADVVKHYVGSYEKRPVYRAIKALVTAQVVNEAEAIVRIATAAK
jgi:hypothetical protein